MNEELKKAYEEKTEAQLKEWNAKIEQLKNKVAGMGAEVKIKTLESAEALRKKVEEGKKNLKELGAFDESDWEKAKSKLEGVMEGIKKGIDEIISKL